MIAKNPEYEDKPYEPLPTERGDLFLVPRWIPNHDPLPLEFEEDRGVGRLTLAEAKMFALGWYAAADISQHRNLQMNLLWRCGLADPFVDINPK